MISKFYAEKPSEIKFTLNITMSLKEWRELREQLSVMWPSSALASDITDMTMQAEKNFYVSLVK